MIKFLTAFVFLFTIVGCSNTPDLETGEIKTLTLLNRALEQSRNQNIFIDARKN